MFAQCSMTLAKNQFEKEAPPFMLMYFAILLRLRMLELRNFCLLLMLLSDVCEQSALRSSVAYQ